MSTSGSITFRADSEADYAVEGRGSFEKIARQNRRPQYRRSGTAPGSVNGMHRRRQSRWTWGHGRGARLDNLRAIARCVVAAAAGLAATTAVASAVSIDFVNVGNPGNAANPSAPSFVASDGGGSVPYAFDIGRTEVTNAQYASFLNSIASVDDPNGVFKVQMQIVRSGSPGAWTYAPSAGNANKPVTNVTFFDTFRFANWLENGMPTGTQTALTTEAGTYNMTLAHPVRNPDARFWIPSVNEWYKAAFYDPATSSYFTYPTSSSTLAAQSPVGTPPAANFASVVGATTDVESYVGSVSPYGLYDMAGNVAERLDTLNSVSYLHATSNFTSALAASALNSASLVSGASLNGFNVRTGFRVAAVPEPGALGLGLAGAVSVACGMSFRKRRRTEVRSAV